VNKKPSRIQKYGGRADQSPGVGGDQRDFLLRFGAPARDRVKEDIERESLDNLLQRYESTRDGSLRFTIASYIEKRAKTIEEWVRVLETNDWGYLRFLAEERVRALIRARKRS
jgi:hypothetical protein